MNLCNDGVMMKFNCDLVRWTINLIFPDSKFADSNHKSQQ